MAEVILDAFLVVSAVAFLAWIVLTWHLARPLWRVRYFQGKHNGPALPFDERPVSRPMPYDMACDYAAIFGGTVERVPK